MSNPFYKPESLSPADVEAINQRIVGRALAANSPRVCCEVCGERAVLLTCDAIEQEPTLLRDGTFCESWKDGDHHAYCEAHRREPKRTYLSRWTPEELAVRQAHEAAICQDLWARAPECQAAQPKAGTPRDVLLCKALGIDPDARSVRRVVLDFDAVNVVVAYVQFYVQDAEADAAIESLARDEVIVREVESLGVDDRTGEVEAG